MHCLPKAGGLLDQDADLLRMIRIEKMGRREEG